MSRQPPQNLEAERALLGSLLLDNGAFADIDHLITPGDFYQERHRLIYQTMQELLNAHEPVDLVTLTEALRRKGQLEDVGNVAYLIGLGESAPTAAYAMNYARIVQEKAVLRQLIYTSGMILKRAFDEHDDVQAQLDQAEREIMAVQRGRVNDEVPSLGELAGEQFELLERLRKGEASPGVPTGFHDLDRLVNPMKRGSLYVWGARPSMGKTALSLAVLRRNARRGRRVLFFSLEMKALEVMNRIASAEARVNLKKFDAAEFTDVEYDRVAQHAADYASWPLYIDDTPNLSLGELRAKARRLHRLAPLELIAVDYLQLMATKGDNRVQEIGAISRGLKNLARELDVPVILLSQLSRGVESRPNKRPLLSDLRESGEIEQDADVVMFLYRDEYYYPQSEKAGVLELIVAKNRNGPTGVVECQFQHTYADVRDIARVP